ncbi:hypothetical protein EON66_00555 [archaeon]|nr:MAG: hypothetical protein EON66_00555 [archaeon]
MSHACSSCSSSRVHRRVADSRSLHSLSMPMHRPAKCASTCRAKANCASRDSHAQRRASMLATRALLLVQAVNERGGARVVRPL